MFQEDSFAKWTWLTFCWPDDAHNKQQTGSKIICAEFRSIYNLNFTLWIQLYCLNCTCKKHYINESQSFYTHWKMCNYCYYYSNTTACLLPPNWIINDFLVVVGGDTNLINLNITKHLILYFFQVTLMIYYFDAVFLLFGSGQAILTSLSASSIFLRKLKWKGHVQNETNLFLTISERKVDTICW